MKPVASYTSTAAGIAIGGVTATYYFCHPHAAGLPFYLGIPDSYTAGDVPVLQAVLGPRKGRYVQITEPQGEGLPPATRLYDISSRISSFVRNNVGTSEEIPGPNCYQTAFAALGYAHLAGRYVDPAEASYYLTRDFKEARAVRDNVVGGMLVYYRRSLGAPMIALHAPGHGISYAAKPLRGISPSAIPRAIGNARVHVFFGDYYGTNASHEWPHSMAAVETWEREPEAVGMIDAGVHAAAVLPGGMVFHKGCYRDDCGYRIVDGARAMSSIETKRATRFDPLPPPENDDDYVSRRFMIVAPNRRSKRTINAALSARIAKLMAPIAYYADRIERLSDAGWSLREMRIDLLSVENMWNMMFDIEEMIRAEGNTVNMKEALLRIDKEVAEALLRLRSLAWQYNEMVYKFAPIPEKSPSRTRQALVELYADHYIHPDSAEFRQEIKAHLAARLVSPKLRPAIAARVIAKVKEYDPVNFAESNGARGIPFFDILGEAVATANGRT